VSTRLNKNAVGSPTANFWSACFTVVASNFTWWVNRKDAEGRNVFQGGFLGLDNIGCSTAARPCRPVVILNSRMHELDGNVLLDMLAIALELASEDSAYEM